MGQSVLRIWFPFDFHKLINNLPLSSVINWHILDLFVYMTVHLPFVWNDVHNAYYDKPLIKVSCLNVWTYLFELICLFMRCIGTITIDCLPVEQHIIMSRKHYAMFPLAHQVLVSWSINLGHFITVNQQIFGGYKICRFSKQRDFGDIKFGVSPSMQCTINVRSRILARQILAKTRNSSNTIVRQNLLIYSSKTTRHPMKSSIGGNHWYPVYGPLSDWYDTYYIQLSFSRKQPQYVDHLPPLSTFLCASKMMLSTGISCLL